MEGFCRSRGRRARDASWRWPEASTRPPTLARAPHSQAASWVAFRYVLFPSMRCLRPLQSCKSWLSEPRNGALGSPQKQPGSRMMFFVCHLCQVGARVPHHMAYRTRNKSALRKLWWPAGAPAEGRRPAAPHASSRQAPGRQKDSRVLDPRIPSRGGALGDWGAARPQRSA